MAEGGMADKGVTEKGTAEKWTGDNQARDNQARDNQTGDKGTRNNGTGNNGTGNNGTGNERTADRGELLRARFGIDLHGVEVPDAIAGLLDRRVVRRYTDQEVPDPLLDGLLAAAQSAPAKSIGPAAIRRRRHAGSRAHPPDRRLDPDNGLDRQRAGVPGVVW